MASQWSGSDRRSRLPADWSKLRKRVLRRDGFRCTHRLLNGERCPEVASDVDHVLPGDDDRESNLTSLCAFHHQQKSSAEGGRAKAAQWRKNDKKFRRVDPHPGLM